jgi:hypothetical protein
VGFASTPALARNGDGRLELFVRGNDGALWHLWQTADSSAWSEHWISHGDAGVGFASAPALARSGDGRLELFVRGNDGALWHLWQTAPSGAWSEWLPHGGFNLRLMSSLDEVNGIPTEGKNLIIVAAVNNVLHFRIFDADGNVAVDLDERKLVEQTPQIEALRKQLEGLWPPHELTRNEKGRVVTAVTSISGYPREEASIEDRAEEIYHRLALGQPGPVIDAIWISGVEDHLRGAEEELSPKAQLYLASRLGTEVFEPSGRALEKTSDIATWERMVKRRVRDLLVVGKAAEALELLGERPERGPASPLHSLLARVLVLLGRWEDARRALRAALATVSAAGESTTLLELLIFSAFVDEHQGELTSATLALDQAEALLSAFGDEFDGLALALARLRVARRVAPSELEAARAAALARFQAAPDAVLLQSPVLTRRLAGELAEPRTQVDLVDAREGPGWRKVTSEVVETGPLRRAIELTGISPLGPRDDTKPLAAALYRLGRKQPATPILDLHLLLGNLTQRLLPPLTIEGLQTVLTTSDPALLARAFLRGLDRLPTAVVKGISDYFRGGDDTLEFLAPDGRSHAPGQPR